MDVANNNHRLRIGGVSNGAADENRQRMFSEVVDIIISESSERDLMELIRSDAPMTEERAAMVQRLVKPITAGMAGNFQRLCENLTVGCVVVWSAGTPAYAALTNSLCKFVSDHHRSDFQRMAVKLHRTIAQKKHDEASEPWASIGNIKADTDKQWLTSALALLGKHRGWIASASIRELLQYLVENKISTDRALREHLGMPVPQRTFDANAALISKQFQGISPEEASSRADKLISQIPALADYVITDIDRFVDGDKGILSRASADLRPTIRKALKRGLATLDGGEVETNMTWETSFRKVHDFLVYAEPESNYQMLEALYDLLGLGDPEHVWSLMKRGVETALGAMTEQDRQREAASFCARLTTLSMATDSAPSGSVDPKAQPPQ